MGGGPRPYQISAAGRARIISQTPWLSEPWLSEPWRLFVNQPLNAYIKSNMAALPLALAVFFIPLVAYIKPRASVPILIAAVLFSLVALIRRKEMPAIPGGPLLWLLILF